ncbi:MAG: VCBS repeat-containing protein [Planctomycetales bacterium]|nr:VCBS repeat-containing protein [Planctomycetales bacterium]
MNSNRNRHRPHSVQRSVARTLQAESLESRHLLTAVADLDGDGDLDAYFRSAWFENIDGEGNFFGHTFSDQQFAVTIAADMDNDGDLDLVTSEPRWYENTGGRGLFSVAHDFPDTALTGSNVKAIDLGHDGDLDIVVFTGETVSLYKNVDGRGTMNFAESASFLGLQDADDIDGDGDLDFVVLRDDPEVINRAILFRGDGNGGYVEEEVAHGYVSEIPDFERDTSLQQVQILPIDGDDFPDIVVSSFSYPLSSISWRKNHNGRIIDGGFVGGTSYGRIWMADVDQDGDLDCVETSSMSGSITWQISDGNGKFTSSEDSFFALPLDGFENSIIADVNSDGEWDLIPGQFNDGAPSWLDGATRAYHLNVVPALGVLEPGDANKDYFFDASDLVQVAKHGFPLEDAIWESGDWNGDLEGTPDQPAQGDGRFNAADLDAAFATGLYLTGAYDDQATVPDTEVEAMRLGVANSDLVLSYSMATGELNIVNNGTPLTAFQLVSTSGLFDETEASDFDGRFDVRSNNSLFKLDFGGFANVQLGAVLPQNLDWGTLQRDLKIDGARLGGGGLGRVRLTCSDCRLNIDVFQQALRNDEWDLELDYTRDGIFDQDDLRFFVHEIIRSSVGDSNLDGVFDSADLVAVFSSAEYEDNIAGNSTWAEGDWNGDGDFDTSDLVWAFQVGVYADRLPEPLAETGTVAFTEHNIHIAPSSAPPEVVEGDFDGDGDLDLLGVSFGIDQVVWYENIREGLLSSPKTIANIVGGIDSSVVTDLDQDGDVDIVVALGGFNASSIVWYENLDGKATFSEAHVISDDRGGITMDVADLDNDGDLDIVAGHFPRTVNVYINAGQETFQHSATIDDDREAAKVLLRDLNADGYVDVLIQRYDKTYWLRNDRNGGFTEAETLNRNFSRIDIGDIDADGDLDLIGSELQTGQIVVHRNDGQGTFDAGSVVAQHERALTTLLVDFDNDDDLDVVVTGFTVTSFFENQNGAGDFKPFGTPLDYPAQLRTTAFDVDNDGDQDLYLGAIVKNDGTGGFSVFDDFAFPYAGRVNAVFAGDIDGDSDVDVVAGSVDSNFLLHQNLYGEAMFAWPVPINDDLPNSRSFGMADIDGDGDLDLVSSSRNNNTLVWHENENGEGLFGSPRIIGDDAESITWVKAGDLDGDGDIDIAATIGNKLVWYENNNGLGRYGTIRVVDDHGTEFGEVADLDGDGDMDIIAGSVWYENQGGGNFDPPSQIDQSSVESIIALDVNGDQALDLVYGGSVLRLKLNDGNGNFADPIAIGQLNGKLSSLFAADMDNDGDLDLLTSELSGNTIAWHENIDGLNFEIHVISDHAVTAESVFAADLDGDGDMDVLSGSRDDKRVAWYENSLIDGD